MGWWWELRRDGGGVAASVAIEGEGVNRREEFALIRDNNQTLVNWED